MYRLYTVAPGATERRVCTSDAIADARLVARCLLVGTATVVVTIRDRRGHMIESYAARAILAHLEG